jgi:hypothetical protein
VAALAFLLLLLGTLQAWRALVRQGAAPRGPDWPGFLAARLAPTQEHRLPIAITLLLPVLVWLLGLAAAVGLTALTWHLLRSDRSARAVLRAALIGGCYFGITHYWVEELASLVLPPGVLWPLLDAAFSR